MKVLFIVPYPVGKAPSQRFRIEQFFPILDKANIEYDTVPFIGHTTWDVLYGNGAFLKKVTGIIGGYLRRFKLLFNTGRYDVFVIHREAAPLGPPVFEWVLAKLLRKKYIYDFDDAIWEPKISDANRLAVYIRSFWKTKYLCRWAYINTAGNQFLADYATRSGAKKTVLLPTVVDTVSRYTVPEENKEDKDILTIGWTGSHSTLPYLESLTAVLKKLGETHRFQLYVIADKPPGKELDHKFIKWNAKDEIEQLKSFDIGIMPIFREPFSEGKCGFKMIQYMAMGIPGIADHTGANAAIVDSGVNGYICHTEEEWLTALKELLENKEKRKKMGQLARQKIVASYSLQSQEQLFLDCLRQCQLANKK